MYTGIGPVLLAMNPYKQISKEGLSIYDAKIAKFYHASTSMEVAPHIFGIASEAYKRLIAYLENQCIIVTGESGAGKTEAAKQLMNFITHICDTGATVPTSTGLTLDQRVQHALGNSAGGSHSLPSSTDTNGHVEGLQRKINSTDSVGDATEVCVHVCVCLIFATTVVVICTAISTFSHRCLPRSLMTDTLLLKPSKNSNM